MTGEPIDAVAAEAGTTSTKSLFVNLFHAVGEEICCPHVVLHAEPAVVAADLLGPGLAEAHSTATVRGNDEIFAAAHHHKVPTCAPELAHLGLWTALTVEQCRIGLRAVVVIWIDQPSEHVLAIDRLDPVFLDLTHAHLREDVVVNGGNLLALAFVVGQVINVNL